MQNLRDKLLKAGLVSQDDARRVEGESAKPAPARTESAPRAATAPREERRPPRRDDRPPRRDERPTRGGPRPALAQRPAAIPPLPPLVLPGTKAYQRVEALKQQELDKKLRDVVYAAQVPVEPGEHRFFFQTRKGKLRRLEISESQAKSLERGELAVVERPEPALIEHSLVPREVAERMLALSQKAVRFLNRDGAPIGFLPDEELARRDAAGEADQVTLEASPGAEAQAAIETKEE